MSEIIGNPRLELEVGKTKYEQGLDQAAASLGARCRSPSAWPPRARSASRSRSTA